MNRAQEIQLERLRLGSFNNLDGELVANDLKNNEDLWLSFVFGRFGYLDLVELRDLPSGHINGDELFILAKTSNVPVRLKLIRDWKADEVGWKTDMDGGGDHVVCDDYYLKRFGAGLGPDHALMRIWWD